MSRKDRAVQSVPNFFEDPREKSVLLDPPSLVRDQFMTKKGTDGRPYSDETVDLGKRESSSYSNDHRKDRDE